MPLFEAVIMAYEKNQKIFKKTLDPDFDLCAISFMSTNFEAFTKLSVIFTRIRRTSSQVKL